MTHVYWFTTHTALMGTQFCLTYCYCFTIHSALKGNPSFHNSLFITHLLFTTYSTLAGKQQQNNNKTDTHLLFYHLLIPIGKTAFHETCLLCYTLLSPNRKTASHKTFSGTHATALYLAMLLHYTLLIPTFPWHLFFFLTTFLSSSKKTAFCDTFTVLPLTQHQWGNSFLQHIYLFITCLALVGKSFQWHMLTFVPLTKP